jgi:hypothetical protein
MSGGVGGLRRAITVTRPDPEKSRPDRSSKAQKPIIFENPVAWFQKIANLCGPTQ